MNLDATKFPDGHLFTEEVSKALGMYVSVANFAEVRGRRIFRMIVDSEIDKKQMRELLFSTVKDKNQAYEFAYLETISGPIVDESPKLANSTTYIRITFM